MNPRIKFKNSIDIQYGELADFYTIKFLSSAQVREFQRPDPELEGVKIQLRAVLLEDRFNRGCGLLCTETRAWWSTIHHDSGAYKAALNLPDLKPTFDSVPLNVNMGGSIDKP